MENSAHTTIVVGAADSETAARAAARAAEMAKAFSARLVVVTAYADSPVEVVGVGSDTYMLSVSDQAGTFAERTALDLATAYGIEATGLAQAGKPEDVILDVARRHEATLIVVGNVRMQGAGRLLGSVANNIAHHAPCDVYVVKTT